MKTQPFLSVNDGNVHTCPALGDSVIFAFTQSRGGAKHLLARRLLQALGRLDPVWNGWSCERPILGKTALGKPFFILNGNEGPSLSFSHGEERLWSAVSTKGGVGIDVAYPDEFADGYPLARAFQPDELGWASALCRSNTASGAALLWSAKEASVKAVGTGFHRFDPLQVRVGMPLLDEHGVLFRVWLQQSISIWSVALDGGWLSVGLAS
jgi:phosphopantetheinyl transferase